MTEITLQDAPGLDWIVRRAAAGDEEALARLIADHHDPMVKVAYA